MKKAKVLRLTTFLYNILHLFYVSLKGEGRRRASFTPPSLIPSTTKKMTNTTLDKAIAAVLEFRDRISLFTEKLRLAQYADGSIYDHHLKIAQAFLSIIINSPSVFTLCKTATCMNTVLHKLMPQKYSEEGKIKVNQGT